MPRSTRISGGVDQTIMRVSRVALTYSYQRGERQARGLDLNSAVNGLRPNPAFRDIIEAVSDAESRRHQVQFDGTINPGAMLPAFKGPLISLKRTTLFINYQLTWLKNNTDGPFAIPATGDLNAEWGPGPGDVRHRANITLNNQIIRNVLVGLNVNATTGDAYTMLTGRDDNGDGIFNDRPAGVDRNTLRATGQGNVNLFLGYVMTFGKQQTLPPGIGVFGGGNAATVRTVDVPGRQQHRDAFEAVADKRGQCARHPQPECAACRTQHVSGFVPAEREHRGHDVRKRLEHVEHANSAIPVGGDSKDHDERRCARGREHVDDVSASRLVNS